MRSPKNAVSTPAQETLSEPLTPAPEQPSKGRSRNPEFEIALGARIRAARVAAKMSQTELGAAVGISFQQVQKYEQGRDRVTASTLQAFAAAMGMHPGTFYGDDVAAPSGSIPDVKAAMGIAKRIQGIRSPAVVRRLMALVDLLVEMESDEGGKGAVQVEQPATNDDMH